MRLQTPCPICQKPLELIQESIIGEQILKVYKCGHAFASDRPITAESHLNLDSLDLSKHARPYQKQGVEFITGTGQYADYGAIRGTSCILADQMRLGKTPQSLLAVKNLVKARETSNYIDDDGIEHSINAVESGPVLILARAANIYQWMREVKTWVDNLPDSVWVIQGTKNWIPPGFKFYICSMDTFSRRGTCKSCSHQYHEDECKRCVKLGNSCRLCISNKDGMSDLLLEFGFKVVIADEAHSFKNTDSQRSQALTAFLKTIERSELTQVVNFNCPLCNHQWQENVTTKTSTTEAITKVTKRTHCESCFAEVVIQAAIHVKVTRNCSIILLTGTPIKNRADEYFVPLNLVAPDRFPSLELFRRSWLVQDDRGRWSRVAKHRWEAFKKEIAPFVLRREKEDVYQDVPKLNRMFTPITIDDERLKKAYNQVVDTLEGMTSNGNYSYFNTIGELQKLRQICGLAKVNFVSDYAETFLMDSDRQKLAIGYHHHSVRDALAMQLAGLGTCKLDGQDSPIVKDRIAHKYFATAPEQILLLGMLAAKEGLELPYIDTALVCEREWSSADEEQFEFRFYNPDQDYLKARGLENKVTNIEYIVAKGTVDEFFYEMVEEKRMIFGETISTQWNATESASDWKSLVERTVAGRL